jgi:phosphoribosylformimino-5-aminoimidazole carboxamide ribotide isomerase
MLIIPAIDLKDGNVVRLYQGKKKDEKIYSCNPVVVACRWQNQGAKLIHVVDLDGAFAGEPKNLNAVKKIVQAVKTPIEFGGGVRDKQTIEELLEIGVQRIILGTKAVEDKNFLKAAFAEFKEKVIVSIDAKGGCVLTEGWQSVKRNLDIIKFASWLKKIGFRKVIYTDTSKDGTLKGPNLEGIRGILKNTGLKVIASGGISSLDDLVKLKKLQAQGLIGAIIGKALYEGKFTLKEALKIA